ncbi:hypothetical protein [Kitasatospora sp. MBT63]|uniref:hypothetical protein n=1 Tax=Kitasatospora sp. MBT63 TaxID=1444768 RepID=UPI00068B1FA8|nr:hypothetical protein [Kitasatospora sp. MBT63]
MAGAEDDAEGELYALPVGEFTAARDRAAARARQGGDRERATRIRKLRRPTAAAHAVNLLARNHPGELTDLLDLGQALRTAQQDGDGKVLRELSARRHRAVTALTAVAVRDAAGRGERLGEAQQREVEQTLRAATAGEEEAGLVAAGRLGSALDESPSGLLAAPTTGSHGGAAGSDAPAPVGADPSAGAGDRRGGHRTAAAAADRGATAAAQQRARRAAARAALEQATGAYEDAQAVVDALARRHDELADRREHEERAVEEARQALRAAEDALRATRRSEDGGFKISKFCRPSTNPDAAGVG